MWKAHQNKRTWIYGGMGMCGFIPVGRFLEDYFYLEGDEGDEGRKPMFSKNRTITSQVNNILKIPPLIQI